MNDERPIMVATDLSARDDRAVDRAIALGRSRHHRVHVVHVTRPTIGVGIADGTCRVSIAASCNE